MKMILLTVYLVGVGLTFLAYYIGFLARWLVDFFTYTAYGMKHISGFFTESKYNLCSGAFWDEALIYSFLWPLTLRHIVKYMRETVNYTGGYFRTWRDFLTKEKIEQQINNYIEGNICIPKTERIRRARGIARILGFLVAVMNRSSSIQQ